MQFTYFALLLCVQLFVYCQCFKVPDQYRKPALILHKHCKDESKADDVDLAKCHTGQTPSEGNSKCYLHCLFSTIGLVDQNTGHFNLGLVRDLGYNVPEEMKTVFDTLDDKCSNQTETDPCDKAYETIECYVKHHPESLRFCDLFLEI